MDIEAWLQGSKDRLPPDDNRVMRSSTPRALKSEHLHDIRDVLARRGLKRRRSESPIYVSDVTRSHRRRNGIDKDYDRRDTRAEWGHPSSNLECSISSELDLYDRRPRKKTRADRYEPKADKQRRRTAAEQKSVSKRQEHGRRRPHNYVHDGRVAQDHAASAKRLTFRPDARFGIFRHGRTSSRKTGRRTGLPDLVFNEMEFLQQQPAADARGQDDAISADTPGQSELEQEEPRSLAVERLPPEVFLVPTPPALYMQPRIDSQQRSEQDPDHFGRRRGSEQMLPPSFGKLTRSATTVDMISASLPSLPSFLLKTSNDPSSSDRHARRSTRDRAYDYRKIPQPYTPRPDGRPLPITDAALSSMRSSLRTRPMNAELHTHLQHNQSAIALSDEDSALLHSVEMSQDSTRYYTSDILRIKHPDGHTLQRQNMHEPSNKSTIDDYRAQSRAALQATGVHDAHASSRPTEQHEGRSQFNGFSNSARQHDGTTIMNLLPNRSLKHLRPDTHFDSRAVLAEPQASTSNVMLWVTRSPSRQDIAATSLSRPSIWVDDRTSAAAQSSDQRCQLEVHTTTPMTRHTIVTSTQAYEEECRPLSLNALCRLNSSDPTQDVQSYKDPSSGHRPFSRANKLY